METRKITTFFLLTQGTQFGQWDTASFENKKQKLKFLKLMGGFKNGVPSLSHPSNRVGRAMSWKPKQGAGLGFSTTPDKIFYIDRNASKLIKFED